MSNWYSKTKDEILTDLKTNEQSGLTADGVNERLKQFGPNELTKTKANFMARIFAQINDVLVYVLLIALISAFVGEWADASIIALVVILNAVIGVIQESKAEQALEALKKMATPKAIVKRAVSYKKFHLNKSFQVILSCSMQDVISHVICD